MKKFVIAFLVLMQASIAYARNIDGVAVPESISLAGEKAPLALNGAGLRTRYMAKVYVAALYLAQPATQPEHILDSSSARFMAIHMRRDTDAEKVASAFLASVLKNHDRTEMQSLQDRLTKFKLMIPAMKRNDVLHLEFTPDGETRVAVNNQLRGMLPGPDFQRALLRIWLGAKPVDDGLKRSLLGERVR